MSYVPAGVQFGGDSGEDDFGFDFGDSPQRTTQDFAEPSLSTIVSNGEKPNISGGEGDTAAGPKARVTSSGVKLRRSPGMSFGFGSPSKLTNQRTADGRRQERKKKRGHGSEGGDVVGRGRMMVEGEELRVAITKGSSEEILRILEDGFDPNFTLTSGWTALMYACDVGNDVAVEILLNHGADPNTQKDMFSALMAVCSSKIKREEALVNSTRLLINRGARVNGHDRHHMSPLLYACQNGRCGLAELLISTSADINKQDTRGWTPLFYAASIGNTQLIHVLLEANANTEITCNQGETPANIAYANGHNSIVDLLEGMTSSPRRPDGGSGLTGGGVQGGNDNTPNHYLTKPSSKSECVRYGDLELFLLGLQLGDLLPLFQTHRIAFSDLLSMTDRDLEQMGVTQVGVRKKILDGILGIHKREWEMPKQILPYNKNISSAEAAVILTHLARHATYIKGTAAFLLTHARSNPDMLDPNMEPKESEKLTNELTEAVTAVSSLQEEVHALQTHIHHALGTVAPQGKSPPLSRGKRLVAALTVCGLVALSAAFIGGRFLLKKP